MMKPATLKQGAPEATGPMTCDLCNRSFKNAWSLKVHRRRSHGEFEITATPVPPQANESTLSVVKRARDLAVQRVTALQLSLDELAGKLKGIEEEFVPAKHQLKVLDRVIEELEGCQELVDGEQGVES